MFHPKATLYFIVSKITKMTHGQQGTQNGFVGMHKGQWASMLCIAARDDDGSGKAKTQNKKEKENEKEA